MYPYLSFQQTIASWIFQVLAAVIMLQTLYFKFSGSEESIYIFSTLQMEPWGRYGTGIAELIASIVLLIPAWAWLGALLTFGIMTGALIAHFSVLGLEVKEDGGYLFILALLVFAASLVILLIHRKRIPKLNFF